jgi:hypothetical protein
MSHSRQVRREQNRGRDPGSSPVRREHAAEDHIRSHRVFDPRILAEGA